MSETEIHLERETANDESAVVVAIHVASGTLVEKDQVLFDIENSKATQEVEAPATGILVHCLHVGEIVEFGVPLARIVPPGDAVAALSPENARPTSDEAPEALSGPPVVDAPHAADPSSQQARAMEAKPLAAPHFSREASSLLKTLGLSPSLFQADFVTSRDVRARLGERQNQETPSDKHAVEAVALESSPPLVRSPGANHKRAEIDALSKGAGGTMLSVLGVDIGPLQVARSKGDALAGRITDLVIYESARLMRKYPRLNASYIEGGVVEHASVHTGIAIDGGGKLMVYGIENADRIELHAMGGIIVDAVARYIENTLTAADLTRATYTVTDLSEAELDFVFPLLPRGQSCILGVTHSDHAGFRLFAGFDHRVTEGREVATFLSELRDRLVSFASGPDASHSSATCAYCSQSLGEATSNGRSKGLLKLIHPAGHEILCCASCWHGW